MCVYRPKKNDCLPVTSLVYLWPVRVGVKGSEPQGMVVGKNLKWKRVGVCDFAFSLANSNSLLAWTRDDAFIGPPSSVLQLILGGGSP